MDKHQLLNRAATLHRQIDSLQLQARTAHVMDVAQQAVINAAQIVMEAHRETQRNASIQIAFVNEELSQVYQKLKELDNDDPLQHI